jgi:hypothetical protein
LIGGDDYQLPPIDSGAFQMKSAGFASTISTRPFDVVYGEKIFLELASKSMALNTLKRVLPDQKIFRDLLLRLRAESETASNFDVHEFIATNFNLLFSPTRLSPKFFLSRHQSMQSCFVDAV